jgi:hypothetical protein
VELYLYTSYAPAWCGKEKLLLLLLSSSSLSSSSSYFLKWASKKLYGKAWTVFYGSGHGQVTGLYEQDRPN